MMTAGRYFLGLVAVLLLYRRIFKTTNKMGSSYLQLTHEQGFTVGMRRNNPGNLKGKKGIYRGETVKPDTKLGSTFYAFVDMPHGLAAMLKLMMSRIASGTNTIRKLQPKYAPASDGHNPALWIGNVSKYSKFNPDQVIDFEKDTMHRLCWGIIKAESKIVEVHNGIKAIITDGDFEEAWTILSNPQLP